MYYPISKILILYILAIIGFWHVTYSQSIQSQYPVNNSTIIDNQPEFSWQGCEFCDFQLSSDIDFLVLLEDESSLDTNIFNPAPLVYNDTLYWRVRETGDAWSDIFWFKTLNPSTISNLQLWLKADSLEGLNLNEPVVTWPDLSINGNDLTQSDPTKQPLFGDLNLNGKKTVVFDGANDILTGGDIMDIGTDSKTILIFYFPANEPYSVVGKGPSVSSVASYSIFPSVNNFRWIVRENIVRTLPSTISHEIDDYYYVMTEYDRDEGQMRININGNDVGSLGNLNQSTDYNNTEEFVLGGYTPTITSFQFQGQVSEVFVFNKILSDDEKQDLASYIRYEYAPPVDLGLNFTQNGFCDTVLIAKGFKNVTWNDGSTADSLLVTSSGKYWVTAEDIFGNISSDTIYISYPGNFIDDFSICSGSDSLWDTGLNPTDYSFIWNDSSGDPFINIDSPGEYYTQITDVEGCVFDSDTVQVIVDDFPNIVTLGPDVDLCAGNSISLVNGDEEAVSYLWSDESIEPSLEVITSGNYWLQVTNENNCVAFDTIFVNIVGQAPTASFSFANLCFGETVEFTDLSTPPSGENINLWNWDFGDTNTSADQNVENEYDSLGTYTVSLYIETDAGCSDLFSTDININPVPMAGFNVENLCADQLTFFSDASTIESGNISVWSWMFGDSSSGFGSTINHVYQESGSFDVQYVVMSDVSCSDTIIQTININGSPISNFSTSSNCLGQPTVFNAEVDDSESGPISSYFWDFDNGFTSIFPNTSQTYFIPDQYFVTLTATSQLGCSDDTTIVVTINDLPEAGFIHLPACIDEPTLFNDTTLIFLNDSIVEWEWNFSNLSISNDQNPIYSFENTGSFIVSLNVTSISGCESSTESIVNVFEDPNPDFSFNPVIGLPPLEVSFDNLTEDALTYQWLFGDGGMSNEFSPEYTYSDTGIYQATLIAFNEQNCQEDISKDVLVIEPIFDLALLDLTCELVDGRINTWVTVFNFGNHDLLNFDLKLDIGNGAKITEKFTGVIRPGDSEVYNFIASPDYSPQIDQPFLCVTLSNPNGNNRETSDQNNTMCKALQDDTFMAFPPFPNPAEGIISFNFILPSDGQVIVEVFDTPGRKVKNETLTGIKGVNLGTLTIPELRNGNYILKITFLDIEETHWFNVK